MTLKLLTFLYFLPFYLFNSCFISSFFIFIFIYICAFWRQVILYGTSSFLSYLLFWWWDIGAGWWHFQPPSETVSVREQRRQPHPITSRSAQDRDGEHRRTCASHFAHAHYECSPTRMKSGQQIWYPPFFCNLVVFCQLLKRPALASLDPSKLEKEISIPKKKGGSKLSFSLDELEMQSKTNPKPSMKITAHQFFKCHCRIKSV